MDTTENKDADAVCTAARKAKGSVVLFEQPAVGPPCVHICPVCAASGNDTGDTCTVGDKITAEVVEKGVWSDDKDDLVHVLLIVGKGRWGRPRKPRPAEAK